MSKNKNPPHCFVNGAGGRSASSIVVELLSCGQQNATPRRELEKMTGWSGRMVRLMIEKERRAGIPILSRPSQRGDHIVVVTVKIPTQMSEAERNLYKQLYELKSGKKPQESLMDKVKGVFQ